MTIRLLVCLLAAAASLPAAYVYDYSQAPVVADSARWHSNGSPSFTTGGVTFSSAVPGDSLISIPGMSGVNPNDYEIKTTLSLKSGGGTYIHFLRAASGTVRAGVGSYVSIEISIPSGWPNPNGMATITTNQCTNGSITSVYTTQVGVHDGMVWRTVAVNNRIWVYFDDTLMIAPFVTLTTGAPGIGGYAMPAGSGFSTVALGGRETTPPGVVSGTSVITSVLPTSVSMRWQGVLDDANGSGMWAYQISRNGSWINAVGHPGFVDNALQPSTTYTYQIYPTDIHNNISGPTTFTVTTPAAQQVDPKRVGVRGTGSYWGGAGEQIDMLSGNLNYSLPIVSAQMRTGAKIPIGLTYNSQNWRRDNTVDWQLGSDVGYGFGWKMLIGSLTPYYVNWMYGVDHYVYTDSTGAEYRLDVNNNGMWSSKESAYVWYDQTGYVLHFKDGSHWLMGCVSGGDEPDAGTLYPTAVEDVSGNLVSITYDTGMGLPYVAGQYSPAVSTPNSSSRILVVSDVTFKGWCSSWSCPPTSPQGSYMMTYDRTSFATPHLTLISSYNGNGRSYSFTYGSSALAPPFGTDSSFTGVTTEQLTSMTASPDAPYTFGYDTSGSGELTQVTFPTGGHLRWVYTNSVYPGSRSMRQVTTRYLAADSGGLIEWTYTMNRLNLFADPIYDSATLLDSAGNSLKTWQFNSAAGNPLNTIGLPWQFTQKSANQSVSYTSDVYTWSQDSAGNPYISGKTSTSDPGTSYAVTATTAQALDSYGNITESEIHPYNSPGTVLKTYGFNYVTDPAYLNYFVANRLLTETLTIPGGTKIPVINTYQTYPQTGSQPQYNIDLNPPVPFASRGYLLKTQLADKTINYQVDSITGVVTGNGATDGSGGTLTYSPATDYAAPSQITSQSYQESLTWSSWFGLTSTTGLNGEQLTLNYDGYGRPGTATSPYGWGTTYDYSTNYSSAPPYWQTKAGPDGFTKTTLDGLGRPIRVERGADAAHLTSAVDTAYGPCACSPLGKIMKVSPPYPAGSSPTAATVYTYDGIGRTLSVTQPDGASKTTYSYQGNQTMVTDPAGKWKKFTRDVEGNLTSVTEPDPASQPSGTLTTNYTYDWMNNLIGVSMPRGSATQTRTFVYNDARLLTSATNPENGTVQYFYNADNTLQYKHDAKGQDTVYTYDSKKRLLSVQYFAYGKNGSYYSSDPCSAPKVSFTWDTNSVNANFSANAQGRLATASYNVCLNNNPGGWQTARPVTEMYSYHAAGAVLGKQVQLCQPGFDANNNPVCNAFSLEADYSYDGYGRVNTYTGRLNDGSSPPWNSVFTYAYDWAGRPFGLTDNFNNTSVGAGHGNRTWVQNVQYDLADRMKHAEYLYDFRAPNGAGNLFGFDTEDRQYNVNGQLTSQSWALSYGNAVSLTYTYSGTQNNGQITGLTDAISGETITYQYDALKRLIQASSTPNAGSSVSAWTQSFQYDGFGNLTAKVLNGATTPLAVNGTSNRLSNAGYDANGNMYSGAGTTLTYDVANRVLSGTPTGGGTEYYGYDPQNKQIYRQRADHGEEWTLYGAFGERLGVYPGVVAGCGSGGPFVQTVYFAGKQIALDTGCSVVCLGNTSCNPPAPAVRSDRLGTNRIYARVYPYGEDIIPLPQNFSNNLTSWLKFATYYRDGLTGLDYADQRYYASGLARFTTADPYRASAGGSDPGSWNRYAYAGGDPINRIDPTGRFWCDPSDPACDSGCDPDDPTCDDGDGGGGTSGGSSAPPLKSFAQQPCWADENKSYSTLLDLANNVEDVFAASDPNATSAERAALDMTLRIAVGAEWNSINDELGGGSIPNPSVWNNLSASNNPITKDQFNGGHFVLSGVDITAIQDDLGGENSVDYNAFVKDFTGRVNGRYQRAVSGQAAQHRDWLHSHMRSKDFTFHFDDYSPFNNPAGHLAVDVGLGHLPGVCLDAAWH